jgi:hypothetical protein
VNDFDRRLRQLEYVTATGSTGMHLLVQEDGDSDEEFQAPIDAVREDLSGTRLAIWGGDGT